MTSSFRPGCDIMTTRPLKKCYLLLSLGLHVVILLLFIVGLEWSGPLVVVENTDKHDVMSAVILGDTEKSKILTTPSANTVTPAPTSEVLPKKIVSQTPPEPKAISLATKPKPALTREFEKALLADLEKIKKQNKKKQAKQLQAQFE